MATVANTTAGNAVASAEATISAIQAQVAGIQATAEAKIAGLVATLTAHAAAHQAEVDAAQAVIAKAVPAATARASEAAAFVLTSNSKVQGLVNFIGKNWRYVAIALAVGVIGYAKFGLGVI